MYGEKKNNTSLIIFAVLAAFGLMTALMVVAPNMAQARPAPGGPGFGPCFNPGIAKGHGGSVPTCP